jgi:transcriptional regulator with XRE-family HTH domain
MAQTYEQLFAANMRAARARAGISQATLAKRMKRLGFGSWSSGKASECERGTRAVVVAELLALSVSLECTLRDLVGEAAPDARISFPEVLWEISGTHVRNSGYGWNDYSVTWTDEDHVAIVTPANMYSAFAADKSHQLGVTPPNRIARQWIGNQHPELARKVS